eukprot:gene5737-biopygen924
MTSAKPATPVRLSGPWTVNITVSIFLLWPVYRLKGRQGHAYFLIFPEVYVSSIHTRASAAVETNVPRSILKNGRQGCILAGYSWEEAEGKAEGEAEAGAEEQAEEQAEGQTESNGM